MVYAEANKQTLSSNLTMPNRILYSVNIVKRKRKDK